MKLLIISTLALMLQTLCSVSTFAQDPLFKMWFEQERVLQELLDSGTGTAGRTAALSPSANCTKGTGIQFASSTLHYLDSFPHLGNNGFDQPNNTGTYSAPIHGKPVDSSQQIYWDVAEAFDSAPMFLKDQLCKLTYLFIDTTPAPTDYDWGFWEAPDQRTGSKVGEYVSLLDWTKGGLDNIDVYEKKLTNFILSQPIDKLSYTTSPNGNNTKILTLLSRLGHEIGHIVWFQKNVESWECGDTDLFAGSWTQIRRAKQGFHKPTDVTGISGVATGGNLPQNIKTTTDVDSIYESGIWASVFAQFAPDEDFAETYRMLVITDSTVGATPQKYNPPPGINILANPSPLTSLVADSVSEDVVQEINNTSNSSPPTLAYKAVCIRQHLGIPPPPS